MKFAKLSYFISAVLLMIFHSHTNVVNVNGNLVISKSSLTQTFLQSALPQNTPLADIEAFEFEDDNDDDESKTHEKVIPIENTIDNFLIFRHLRLNSDIPSYQVPLLSYKSLPSFLQVFII